MNVSTKYFLFISTLLVCLLSAMADCLNDLFFYFPGNNYFPQDALLVGILLPLILTGCYLQFGKTSIYTQIMREIIGLFLVMSIIALATNAIQYTPFTPIDTLIMHFDTAFHVDMKKIIAWTAAHDWFKKTLAVTYESLPYQMCFLPLILIVTKQFSIIREYYCLLILSAFIGFSFYYFLPTTGPASHIQSPYFSQAQYATGIKFREIHQHKKPSTQEGGMIAFPSFHVIWAWLCLYLVRCYRFIFILLLPINLLLMASCLLLGWHYPLDLLGSLLVLLLTHRLYNYFGHTSIKEPA